MNKSIILKNKPVKIIKDNIGLLYIAPWLVGFLVLQFYPFIASIFYSFTDFNMMKAPNFVGLDNYIDLLTNNPLFLNSLTVTLVYVLFAVPMKLAFALLVAMILNTKLRMISIFRTVYYLPSILGGSIAVSVLWRILFMREGIINRILAVIHIPPLDWLGDTRFALFTISLLTVWQFGSSMVLFLAGLKQIPAELYEACKVDGASKIRVFFSVTLPLLTPILFFNLVMQMILAFQEFTAAFVITNGGPLNSTYLYGLMLYENAFRYFKMGYASALSWVLFLIIMVVTAFLFKSSASWTHYEDGGDF